MCHNSTCRMWCWSWVTHCVPPVSRVSACRSQNDTPPLAVPSPLFVVAPLPQWRHLRNLEKFGVSSNCRKCARFHVGDGCQLTVGHSQTCRRLIFAAVAKDSEMESEIEARETVEQKVTDAAQVPQKVQAADVSVATSPNSKKPSSSTSAFSSSSSQAGDGLMTTSATAGTTSATKRKRRRIWRVPLRFSGRRQMTESIFSRRSC